MKLIIGLGNVGSEYTDTRHNIGFMVVEKLAKELGDVGSIVWKEEKDKKAWVARVGEVLLVKPTTFMNRSGEAVKKMADYYKLTAADIWVIHDDIDLPLGKLRIRSGGASAGHNGVESIMAAMNTDKFTRFRLGIGRGKDDKEKSMDVHKHHRTIINFVLSRFTDHEAGDMRKLVKHGVTAVRISLIEGLDKAMNRFN